MRRTVRRMAAAEASWTRCGGTRRGSGRSSVGSGAREEEATRALEEYEAAGPGMMELARRFGEVKRACAEVEGEIKRLERREGQ